MEESKILVVDDEQDLCEILQFNLESEGYTVETCHSAEEALQKTIPEFDLLLLDVMMGEISGFKLASILRKDPKTKDVPIIFLTAKDSENDTLTGFTLGADDYISKPFSIRELIARVKAVLRRVKSKEKEDLDILVYEGLQLYLQEKKVKLDGVIISLTKKEFEILRLFLEHQGRVFSRDEMLERIWRNEAYVLDRTIDVNITRLRKKIGIYGQNIVTRLGYGYCFETLV